MSGLSRKQSQMRSQPFIRNGIGQRRLLCKAPSTMLVTPFQKVNINLRSILKCTKPCSMPLKMLINVTLFQGFLLQAKRQISLLQDESHRTNDAAFSLSHTFIEAKSSMRRLATCRLWTLIMWQNQVWFCCLAKKSLTYLTVVTWVESGYISTSMSTH